MARRKKSDGPDPLEKARVLDLLSANPGATKRDISRQLGLKGADRIVLKRILKELEEDGTIERGRKRSYSKPGTLPPVTVLEIAGQDNDGELIARPQRWEGEDAPPKIIVVPGRDDKGPALGAGEKILARLREASDGLFEARIIKRLGASVHRVLGVLSYGAARRAHRTHRPQEQI